MTNEELLAVLRSRYPRLTWEESDGEVCDVECGINKFYRVLFLLGTDTITLLVQDEDGLDIYSVEATKLKFVLGTFEKWINSMIAGLLQFTPESDAIAQLTESAERINAIAQSALEKYKLL